MVANAICGRCGAPLENSYAACRNCGANAAAASFARRRKSPLVAAALGIVPGLGHIYLGHYGRGAGFMAATGLLQFFGFDLDLTAIGALAGVPIELGGFGLWMFSIFDAYRTARRMNQGS